jgi:hypothetical protein
MQSSAKDIIELVLKVGQERMRQIFSPLNDSTLEQRDYYREHVGDFFGCIGEGHETVHLLPRVVMVIR